MAEDFMAMYKQALERLSTGGMSLEASLQEIEEGKRQAIGRGQQALVSGGLGGTTVMGGVPLQAEKIAAGQRLGARGRAESKYLTTLASFAAFAQRGEEAQKQREYEAQQARFQRQYATRQTYQQQQYGAEQTRLGREYGAEQLYQQQQYGAEQAQLGREWEAGQVQLGREYSQQFPSLYGQEETAVPNWMGGVDTGAGAVTPTAGVGAGGGYAPQTGDYMSVEGGPGGPILGGGATTSYGGATDRYAPRTPAESAAAIKAGYYGKQGQQLKSYTRADAERLGFA